MAKKHGFSSCKHDEEQNHGNKTGQYILKILRQEMNLRKCVFVLFCLAENILFSRSLLRFARESPLNVSFVDLKGKEI